MRESADRRGMDASTRGMGRVTKPANRRGMRVSTQAWTVCANQLTAAA